jgi:hypothetical protein
MEVSAQKNIGTSQGKHHIVEGNMTISEVSKVLRIRRYFALAMTNMEDYEREIEPLKRRLHRIALTPGCTLLELGMGTGPNLRYQNACPVCFTSRCHACHTFVYRISNP